MPSFDFSPAEYEQRVSAVRNQIRARNADVLVVDQLEHLVYLFGYLPTAARYQCCLLPLDGEPHMIVRALDVWIFRDQSWVRSYATYMDNEDSLDVLIRELHRLGYSGANVAVEKDSNFMTVQRYERLRTALPQARFVDFSSVLWELRLIKSDTEVRCLREAAKIADAALSDAVAATREGRSEREPAAAAYATAIKMGADNGRVLIAASGPLSDSIHGRLGHRRLQAGDLFHLELVPQFHGYSARIMRPTVIGAPAPGQRETADQLIAIQDAQIAAMRPGALAAEVDQIGREGVIRSGLRSDYSMLTGYTLGYHAQPRTGDHTRVFMPEATWTLAAGMVFHMYLTARGMAFSETVLVGPERPERLTQSARALTVR